jgi:hypothetical protein
MYLSRCGARLVPDKEYRSLVAKLSDPTHKRLSRWATLTWLQLLTATMLGVWRWTTHLTSGRAAWMAEWSMKPARFTPKLVVPSSTHSPCTKYQSLCALCWIRIRRIHNFQVRDREYEKRTDQYMPMKIYEIFYFKNVF